MQNIIENVVSLFTRVTYHLNRSVILTVRNVVHQNPLIRTIFFNVNYIAIWTQPRDMLRIQLLGRQMFPRYCELFLEAYKIGVSRRYGYLFLNFWITAPTELCIQTCVFSKHGDRFARAFGSLEVSWVFRLVPKSSEHDYGLTAVEDAAASRNDLTNSNQVPKNKINTKSTVKTKLKKLSGRRKFFNDRTVLIERLFSTMFSL